MQYDFVTGVQRPTTCMYGEVSSGAAQEKENDDDKKGRQNFQEK